MVQQSGRFVPVKINGEKEGVALVKKLKIEGYPTIVFLDPNEKVVYKQVGYSPPGPFAAMMAKADAAFRDKPKLQKAVKANPKDLDAWISLHAIYAGQGDLAAAEGAYWKLVPLDPTDSTGKMADAHNAMGDAYQNLNRYDKAIPRFLLAAKSADEAKAAYALISLAYCHLGAGDAKAAVPHLERLVAMGKGADEYRDQAKSLLKRIQDGE